MVSDELMKGYLRNLQALNEMRRQCPPVDHTAEMRKTMGTMQIQMGELNEQVRRLLARPRCLG